MDKKLTFAELDTEMVSLLPTKETLYFNHNWSNLYASNSSMALNAGTYWSQANSQAVQMISVSQG
jgi:hypothetical protein